MIAQEPGSDLGASVHEEQPPTFDMPTNHVSISKYNGEVKGAWVLDPRIQVPATFLPTLPLGETEDSRKNLYIKSHDGALSIDVSIVPSEGAGLSSGRTVALLEAHTVDGPVKFNLHDAPGQDGLVRLPVKATMTGHHGAIYIRIPRSFRGVINAKYAWGSAKLSEGIIKQARYLKEENWMKRMFIGEFDESDFADATWAGDEINAHARRGNVYFSYEDEDEIIEERHWSNQGPLSQLLDTMLSIKEEFEQNVQSATHATP